MKYLNYQGLQEYDALIKQYIQDNIPDSSEAADVATALKNAFNPNSNIKIAICTQAEYNALQNPESNVLYIISDETSEVVNVEANPTGTATTGLTKIRISNVIYSIPQIEANPTLSGNETTLTGLGINGVNYAMPSGGGSSEVHLYEHNITLQFSYTSNYGGATGNVTLKILTTTNTILTRANVMEIILARGFTNANNCYSASGFVTKQSSGVQSATPTNNFIIVSGIYSNYNSTYSFTFAGSKLELTSNNDFNITMASAIEINNSNITIYTDTVTQIF